MIEIPEVFDWVTARSKCSVEAIYMALKETVGSDVTKMRDLSPDAGAHTYEVNLLAHGKFIVVFNKNLGGFLDSRGVVFERTESSIHVKAVGPDVPERTLFVAKPALTADGRCLLEVDGRGPLYLWQVSKLALEGLLFGANP